MRPSPDNGTRVEQSGWAGIRIQGKLPRTAVFKTADESTERQEGQEVRELAQLSVADCVALLLQDSPDLMLVVEAPAELPEVVRAGIVAMFRITATAES